MNAFFGEVYFPAKMKIRDDKSFVLFLSVKEGRIILYGCSMEGYAFFRVSSIVW